MISTKKNDLLGVFKFKPEKKGDNFNAVVSSVNIISQKYVFLGRRIPIFLKYV